MKGGANEQTDKQTKVPCVLQDFVPFGAAAQKEEENNNNNSNNNNSKNINKMVTAVSLV